MLMTSNQNSNIALTWNQLKNYPIIENDRINGLTNSYSNLRLYNINKKEDIKVTLYRDNHAWCPYCQKIWLWLEFKKIPYKIKKITMRCYGNKEDWYLKKVPSGMLPAIEINNNIITESDYIIVSLENLFGPLGLQMDNKNTLILRNLEREIFRHWCIWLCYPSLTKKQEENKKNQFIQSLKLLEHHLEKSENNFLDPVYSGKSIIPGTADIIFIPYLERMNASLAYYKGFLIREIFPSINKWFSSLENLPEYLGTQSDFHTHAHDLPPQMGGCWPNRSTRQKELSKLIDLGIGLENNEISSRSSIIQKDFKLIALNRVYKHRGSIMEVNPLGRSGFDQPLRAALTNLISEKSCPPSKDSAKGLRYLRDRVSVPRDMPLLSARYLRQALEKTAKLDGNQEGPPIPKRNRFDQDPSNFIN
tara:strand:- start:127 stop:1383 length:1257 start_codon:yes stop_codon:yes gene_type:complete